MTGRGRRWGRWAWFDDQEVAWQMRSGLFAIICRPRLAAFIGKSELRTLPTNVGPLKCDTREIRVNEETALFR